MTALLVEPWFGEAAFRLAKRRRSARRREDAREMKAMAADTRGFGVKGTGGAED
jgi:hypothetical protein